jgi:hypothetical protein
MADVKHGGHSDSNPAYHVTWDFRPEAIFLSQKAPTTNFTALATNLRDWMAQQGTLKYATSYEKVDEFANPHTQPATQLNVIYAAVLNEAHSFANDVSAMDPLDAEIKRIRLNTELTLYSARICECLIKQLVFVTTLAVDDYETAALGELLSRPCKACADSGKPHRVSLLGSLAHRYSLCHEYEECLAVKTRMVNRRRNLEAAHSGVTKFYPKDAQKVRNKFKGEVQRSGNDLIHMLNHIASIEELMAKDLQRDHLRFVLSPTHPKIVNLISKMRNK